MEYVPRSHLHVYVTQCVLPPEGTYLGVAHTVLPWLGKTHGLLTERLHGEM